MTHTQTYSFLFVRAPGAGAGKAQKCLEHSLAALGLMVGGEASFSSGVTGLALCQRGFQHRSCPAYVSKLGHSLCTALPSPGKLDR